MTIMIAQGYDTKENIIFQYNKSAIKIEKIGRSHVPVTLGT